MKIYNLPVAVEGNFAQLRQKHLFWKAMHSLLFEELRKKDSDYARYVHETKVKPFSFKVTEDNVLNIFGFEERFNGYLKQLFLEPVIGRVREESFTVKRVLHATTGGEISLLELLGEEGGNIKFNTLTPLSFKIGDIYLPLPVPQYIFQNLFNRWNALFSVKIPEGFLDEANKRVYLKKSKVETVSRTGLKGYYGFVGVFELGIERLAVNEQRYAIALAKFGHFAGIGVKTSMGFGMVNVNIKKS